MQGMQGRECVRIGREDDRIEKHDVKWMFDFLVENIVYNSCIYPFNNPLVIIRKFLGEKW